MTSIPLIICALGLVAADLLAWSFSFAIAAQGQIPINTATVLVALWLVWFGVLRRRYFRRQPFWSELLGLLKGVLAFMTLGSLAGLLSGLYLQWLVFVPWGVTLAGALLVIRGLMRQILSLLGFWERSALIFGSGENAQQAALALHSEPSMGYVIKAFVVPSEVKPTVQGAVFLNWPQTRDDFEALRPYKCVIALEANQSELRDQLIRQLSQYHIKRVSVIPSMRGVPLFGLEITQFFSHEVLMIHVRNNLMSPLHRWTKRIFDVTGALFLITMLSPLMLWVAYKIWRSDGAPIIFSQPRVGKDLKTFKFYKFRSMVKNAEDMLKQWEATNSTEWQEYTANNFKLANDPRLISIGAFIRRTSIDELPQLFNVLRGEMSLVGPRPLLPREQTDYGDDLSLYAQTPPGLTGLWQVSGRSQTTFEDRVIFDTWYVKNWSIWTDITILFKTWSVVFKRRGAY